MDAQLKAKWIEALRSGEYKQAEGMLHDSLKDAYCCLGVLCKVMGAEFGSAVEVSGDEESGCTSHDYVPHIEGKVLASDEELKPYVCKELGIPNQGILIQMNDGERDIPSCSFSQIADYIEENL